MTDGETADDKLYRDPELVRFYDVENGWGADFDYCRRLAEPARTVLDLGCGTGQLAASLGEGRDVVGVDPAVASGPLVSTINDSLALAVYFSVATGVLVFLG